MSHRPDSSEIETFEEDLADNMKFLSHNLQYTETVATPSAEDLCRWYDEKGTLSSKQMFWALVYWREAQNNRPANGAITALPGGLKEAAPPIDSNGYTREMHVKIAEAFLVIATVHKSIGHEDTTKKYFSLYYYHNEQARVMLADVARKAGK